MATSLGIRSAVTALPKKMKRHAGCQTCGEVGGKLTFVPPGKLPCSENLGYRWMCDDCQDTAKAIGSLVVEVR